MTNSKEYARSYYLANKDRAKVLKKKYRKTLAHKEAQRRYNRRKRRNFSPEAFELALTLQGHRCAICKKLFTDIIPPKANYDVRCADHNHITGMPRGILCQNCNKGLGNFADDPLLMSAAINYLKSPTLNSST